MLGNAAHGECILVKFLLLIITKWTAFYLVMYPVVSVYSCPTIPVLSIIKWFCTIFLWHPPDSPHLLSSSALYLAPCPPFSVIPFVYHCDLHLVHPLNLVSCCLFWYFYAITKVQIETIS